MLSWREWHRHTIRHPVLAHILRGAGMCFDLTPDLRPFSQSPEAADMHALQSDWGALSKDLGEAITRAHDAGTAR